MSTKHQEAEKQRTGLQNKALHKGLGMVSDQLIEKGLSVEYMMSLGVELAWTPKLVKDWFRLIGEKLYGRTSTADLTTKELQDVWEHMNRTLAIPGIHVPFPSIEERMLRDFNPEEYGY